MAGGIVLEAEIIRAVAGLGVFKHDPVSVVGLAADDGQTVVISKLQVFLIDLRHLLHGHHPLAGHDRHAQLLLQIGVDGIFRDLLRKSGDGFLQKIVVIQDQGPAVQVVEPLEIIKLGARRESGSPGDFLVCGDLRKEQDPRLRSLVIADGGLPERFDAADGKSSLRGGPVDIPHALALHGLDISVCHKRTDGPAQRVAGAVVGLNQMVLRGQKLLEFIFTGFDPGL